MASLTLQQITGNTYLIPAPANIGVYVTNDKQAILIDSGNDQEAGRQILKLLNAQGWTLTLIINTHSNADHVGGNAFLQQKTQCRIAAARAEAAFIQDPLLEPAFLFGGFPTPTMRNKFLVAKPSTVTDVIPAAGPILNTGLEAMPLPGHYFEMIGVRTPDDVVFLADSLFSEQIIRKYHLFFLYDIQGHFETLAQLATLKAATYIPSHSAPTTDLTALLEANTGSIQASLTLVYDYCREPQTFEAILAYLCQTYQIHLDANQFVLVGSTLKSYLSYLVAQQRMQITFAEGKMWWQATAA
jgi:glyoxylase-like metal-dependent hydrolase (beta-lactamase superfamily II)